MTVSGRAFSLLQSIFIVIFREIKNRNKFNYFNLVCIINNINFILLLSQENGGKIC